MSAPLLLKISGRTNLATLLLLLSTYAQAGNLYYGDYLFPNHNHSTGAALTMAGGSLGIGAEAPKSSSGNIVISQSAIGFISATTEGYVGSFEVTTGAAQSLTNTSVRYRFQTNPDGILQEPLTEKSNGSFTIGGLTGSNAFDEASLLTALGGYRLGIRLNPLLPTGYQGVVRIARERMIPRLVKAYANYLDSARFRSLPAVNLSPVPGGIGSAVVNERVALVQSRTHLEEALNIVTAIARDPVEGLYLQPQAPFGLFGTENEPPTPLGDETSKLFETYVRVLALSTEVDEKLQRLDYLANYKDPLSDAGPAKLGQGSAAAITARIDFYDDYVTLIGAFTHCESFEYAPISRVRSGIASLSTLKDDISLARLSFTPAARQGSSGDNFVQTSFVPNYVPFLTAGVQGSDSSRTFENLYYVLTGGAISPVAGTLGVALAAEKDAVSASEQVIQTKDVLKEKTTSTLISYNGSLIDLCGSYTNSDGKILPDLQGYLFPLDIRQEVTGRVPSGAISVQYRRITIAQTRYEAAVADFSGLLQRIEITEQGAATRAGIARQTGQSLARVYTTNGDEFALLDKAVAEEQAQAERQIARDQAEAYKRGFWTKLGTTVKNAAILTAGIVAAPATGGASAALAITAVVAASANAAVNEIENWGDFNKQGKAIINSGETKAKSIEALSLIAQQQTRLRAAESADVAMISADGQAQQIEETAKEEIRKIYVELERSKLNILLAEQEIDLAELELVNLIERVGYLLEEYQEAVRMLAELPLNRPDFRYVRDYNIQLAEDQFRIAQMWTYLTLKSAQYGFMTSNTFNQVGDLIETTLKCRNSKEILDRVINPSNGLATLGVNFYLGNSFSAEGATKSVVFSLKDHYYSSGFTTYDTAGQVVAYENASLPVSFGTGGDAASKAYFQQILSTSITGGSSAPVLRLAFSTTFDPRAGNPLNEELQDQLGHVILSGGLDNRKGVFINFRGSGLPIDTYPVRLWQVGTTYLTYRARAHPTAWSNFQLPVRTWSLPEQFAGMTAYTQKNMNPNTSGNAFIDPVIAREEGFDERSPYCDRWELEINGSTSQKNRRLLTTDLTKIEDIQIGMSIKGFNPQLTTP